MTARDRRKNRENYLDEIGLAVQKMVERCGGSLESGLGNLPPELLVRQRDLFVHCGVVGMVTQAVMEHDAIALEWLDWTLGYYLGKDQADQVNQDQFIVAMLTALHDQLRKSYPNTEDPRFIRFVALFRLATMTLGGYVHPDQFASIDTFCGPLLANDVDHEHEQRKRDAEKN